MPMTFRRWPFVALCLALLAALGWTPLAAPAAAPAEQKGLIGPEIQPFQSARFDLRGFVKIDGITVDLTGEGAMAPPDRSSGTYKIGPFTLETVAIQPAVFFRTRFDPEWTSDTAPSELPFYVGPAALAEFVPKGGYSVIGQERIDGKLTTHWSTDLDLSVLLSLAELTSDVDAEVRDAIRSVRATLEVWVANDDRMIDRERVLLTWITPAIEPNGEPLPSSFDVTMNYTRHNQPVSIEPPAPSPSRRPTFNFPRVRALVETLLGRQPLSPAVPSGM